MIPARVPKGQEAEEGTGETRGAGEEQPSRPELTDISISGEDLSPDIVSIQNLSLNLTPLSNAPLNEVIQFKCRW